MFKKITFLLLLITCCLSLVTCCLLPLSSSAWEIKDFNAEILMKKDGSYYVTEKITTDFGYELKHGIYRDIPVKYKRGLGNYNLILNVLGVEDFGGRAYKYKVKRKGKYLSIKIGDPDKRVSGVNNYKITYLVKRGINYFKDYDELYWNVTGSEWMVPIHKASASIYLPKGVKYEEVKLACYTGIYGSQISSCQITPFHNEVEVKTGYLPPLNGLTVLVGIPQGVLSKPSQPQIISWFLLDNWFASIPFFALVFMGVTWFRGGKDPARGSIMPRYTSPEDLTPAEVGTLYDERADLDDITSTLINLAVKGYLKIKETESEKFLFFSKKDYLFTREKDYKEDKSLKEHEKLLLEGIFGSTLEFNTLSDLKNKFYTYLPKIREEIYRELTKRKKYFAANPDKIRGRYLTAGIVIGGIGVFTIPLVNLLSGISIILAGLIVLSFSYLMPRKTKKGVKVLADILGLREFILRAERDRLEKMKLYSSGTFEKILPYAMVFGSADAWADTFKDIYKEPPSWYESPHYRTGFGTSLFVHDLGAGLRTMGSTFISLPKSAGGGGSGFSGGGFSGGGFGGGGGGAW